jgi:hypothetical protein
MFGVLACRQSTEPPYMKNAKYDPNLRLLIINASGSPNTALQQIIHLSNTRHEGYGILLALGNQTPDSKLNSWVGSFRKQDIIAVHPIRIDSNAFPNADRVALEGARFIWIFDSPEILKPEQLKILEACFKKMRSNNGILVTDSSLKRFVEPMVR